MNRQEILTTLGAFILASGLAIGQTITTFDAPGAGTGAGQGTFSEGISSAGTTFGYYIDARGVAHGFVRNKNGDFLTFSAPGAGTAAGQGTFGFSFNPAGTLAGDYLDAKGAYHGFRARSRRYHHHFRRPRRRHSGHSRYSRSQHQSFRNYCGIRL